MTIYIISFILILFVKAFSQEFSQNSGKKILLFFAFSILTILTTFRSPSVGVDTIVYKNMFYSLRPDMLTRIEPGFVFICYFLREILNLDVIYLFLFCGLLTAISFSIFIYKYSQMPFASLCFFLFNNYYFHSLNLMRQYISLSICILGITLCEEEGIINKRKFLFFVLIAAMFHHSAWITIFWMFPLKPKYRKVKWIFVYGFIGYFLAPMFLQFISDHVYGFRATYNNSRMLLNNFFGSVVETLRLLGVFLFCSYCAKYKSNNNFIIKEFQFSSLMLAVIVEICSMKINLLARFLSYFSIFEIILVPNAVYNSGNKQHKWFVLLFLLLISIMYFVVIAIYRPGWHGAIPYTFA